MKSIDVIIPCYRYAHFLHECVQSVLSQPEVDVRILIIDDASPDNTPAVAHALVESDNRIHSRRHATNLGHIATYNAGLDWAQAEYLLLLSADDVLTPRALTRAVAVLDANPDASMVMGDSILTAEPSLTSVGEHSEVTYQIFSPEQWVRRFCESGVNLMGHATSTAVIRTSAQRKAGHYRHELPHAGDMEMWMRLAEQGSICLIHEAQVFYRQHAGAMHHRYSALKDIKQRRDAFDYFFKYHADGMPSAPALKRMADHCLTKQALGNLVRLGSRSPSTTIQWLPFCASMLGRSIANRCRLLVTSVPTTPSRS